MANLIITANKLPKLKTYRVKSLKPDSYICTLSQRQAEPNTCSLNFAHEQLNEYVLIN